ncbi:hypothetical protein BKA63DRAFT_586386 [Paraphoma chrysanthemicola]|nr:hypothetical protein BKA63DRAFT_586386 [Paraphoma chrysanthemicola]
MFLIFLLLTALTVAVRDCTKAEPELVLPRCSTKHQCIKGDYDKHDNNCADNFRGICQLTDSDPVLKWFSMWGDCVWQNCTNAGDKSTLIKTFERECKDTRESLNSHNVPDKWYQLETSVSSSSKRPSMVTATSLGSKTTSAGLTLATTPRTSSTLSTLETVTSSDISPPLTTTLSGRDSWVPPVNPGSSTKVEESSQPNNRPVPSIAANPHPDSTNQSTNFTTTATIIHTSTALSHSASSPPIQTPIIAGAAAGGTAVLALAIGTVLYVLRRWKHSKSMPSTPASWDPSGGLHAKPTLPDVEGPGEMRGGCGDIGDVKEMSGVPKPIPSSSPFIDTKQPGTAYSEMDANLPTPTIKAQSTSSVPAMSKSVSWHTPPKMADTRGASEVHGNSVDAIEPDDPRSIVELGGCHLKTEPVRGRVNAPVELEESSRVDLDAGQNTRSRFCGGRNGDGGVATNI